MQTETRTPPTLATLILMSAVSAMAMNVFLPSLPRMAQHFQTEYSVIQLSVATYLAMNAILQLIIGPLSDRYGRRPVLLVGLIIYCVATLGCIFAPTIEVFLTCRMIQACVTVGLVLSRAIIRDTVDQDQAASKIGYVTMGMTVVPMLAPALGGYIDGHFGWEGVFWLMFVSGVSTLMIVWLDLGETAQPSQINLLQQFGQYPELLMSPRFWGYAIASAMTAGSFFAYLGGAPYVGSELYHLTPQQLGWFFGAPAVGYFFGNYISGRYAAQIGVNRMVLWGCILTAGGCAVSLFINLIGLGSVYTFFGFMTFVGLGNGMTIPNATAGMLSVRPHLAGTAAGLGAALMIGGGAALSALAGLALHGAKSEALLIAMMAVSALLGLIAILLVIKRQATLE